MKNIQDLIGKKLVLSGWLHGIRGSNRFQFITFRTDGILLQVIAEKEKLGEEEFHKIKSLNQETSLQISGELLANEKAPLGVELNLDSLEIIGKSNDYPITPKEHGTDFLMNHRHLWLRSKRQLAILRVRSELSFQIRNFFHNKSYLNLDTPILTGSVGESAGTLFSTEYFDLGSAYLAQTGQLYLETGIFAHNKVYCFGPTFRAEKSKTKRHLAEFWMVEAETAFCGNDSNIDLQDEFIRTVISETISKTLPELAILERDVEKLQNYIKNPIPRIDYSDAIELLKKHNFSIEWGDDINAEGENNITEELQSPVFIKNYPRAIKAFYMKQNPSNPQTVLCADLIAPEGVGEIIGGSEREEDFHKILERIREEGLPEETYEWYLDLRKYGSVPHSGFGLGLERLVSWICGVPHVRECIPFPRMMYRIHP
ncbi:asparagine--tRNA ligase [Leptospira sp. GIMC2001]|uniref:asparagine--tRNA ligase n=1 Tax=Leptospira sp. GIMC2001 TaxID=1513297 RepID=UPI00234B22E6|nr:asparagine--tRNA ligase [Leptospira sp. GIMC2001]WCL48017.1 asparagine--tRNA ligase [Leptospira sp. GIMC2001]